MKSLIPCLGAAFEKRIERITLTKETTGTADKKPVSAAEKMREKIVRRAACEFQHGMYANLGEEKKTSWDSICFPYECEVGWNDIWCFAIFKVKKWHLALLGPKKMIFKDKKYFQKFAQGLRSIIYSQGISILDPHTLHGGSGSRPASSSIWFGSGS